MGIRGGDGVRERGEPIAELVPQRGIHGHHLDHLLSQFRVGEPGDLPSAFTRSLDLQN